MGRAPVDVMHHHQLPPQCLLRRFARIKVPAKESPAAGRDDRGDLVAQLHQPAAGRRRCVA
jgi:hypothetical protein